MTPQLPKWVTDLAIVGLIFTVGGYATRIELAINGINEDIAEMEKQIVSFDTAISIHHGPNWTEKARSNDLKRVEDLEKTIGGISEKFEERVTTLGSGFTSTSKDMSDIQRKVEAINRWTQQGDVLIKKSRLDKFRALANYATYESPDPTQVSINKQHSRGKNFKIGDRLILENPANGSSVEVGVKSMLDDPNSSNILVQLPQDLLLELGLTTQGGRYELYIQGKPEALRWKSLDQIYQELSAQQ